ncbi:MAG: 30S ribosomal protein S12 methylthiotransferase RimO [Chitinivibrionales bacterium]|nr:30S ribosomal protein S12 methylthiotransferase RimO [Chitinivibrionales bacterium]MBD3358376.1 30S ribosomal protein S12 methylthiotransferase RimO [Chitinivibrionales bacterium]
MHEKKMNKRIHLCNLGCSKNIVDGERIAAYLQESDFELVESPGDAQIIIVNTCAFIREAKEEAIETIIEMARFKEAGTCELIAVAGCFAERYRREAAQDLPEVDIWMGIGDWPEVLRKHLHTHGKPGYHRHLTGSGGTQYLKISDGCSHRCAFCAIPAIRGPFASRPLAEIVEEAQWLQNQGVNECILVSQDTSFYGRDSETTLVRLLETLLANTSFPWIRMMYLHPRFITDDLLSLVGAEQRLCSYFDIPLQHIADPILSAMRRRPHSKETYRLVERIRRHVPDAALRTSFIIGFPGETKSHFEKLLHFVEWARFEKVGVFPFSPEEDTPAYTMRPRPRTATVERRCDTLMTIQREISREINEDRVGTTIPVIIDEVSEDPDYNFMGRTQWDAPEIDGNVYVLDGSFSPGSIGSLRIVDASDYDLFAQTEA